MTDSSLPPPEVVVPLISSSSSCGTHDTSMSSLEQSMGDFSGQWRQERRRRARRRIQATAESAMESLKVSLSKGGGKSRWLSSDEANTKDGSVSAATKNLCLPRRQHSKSESSTTKSLSLPRRKSSITNLRDVLDLERARKIEHQKVPRNDSLRIEDLVALRSTLPPFDSKNITDLQEDEDTIAAPITLRSPLPQVQLLDCEINSAIMLPKQPLRKESIMDFNWSHDSSSNSLASGERRK